jgi:Xaa-Pro aminopeptidase
MKSGFILISSSSDDALIHYLCGVRPPEVAVLLKTGQKIVLVVSQMEQNRFSRTVFSNVQVLCPAQLGAKKFSDWILKLLKKQGISSIKVSSGFPIGLADGLRTSNIEVQVLEKPICPQREIKTDTEIKAIRQSQGAAVAAMKAAFQMISSSKILKDGSLEIENNKLTSEMVRATINHTLIDHDCTAEETIVAGGPLSADPHERGSGPLYAGQPIVIDIFPRSGKTGYWGDITRTVCRGPASTELKKQYNAVKAAQAAQLKMLKHGIRAAAVHKKGMDIMAERGFKTETVDGVAQGFIHGTGHGVGLEIHEEPRVSSANTKALRAGHIVTIEPGLYYSDIGGVRIEDTIVITPDGYKMLAPCPKKLEI